MDRGHDVDVRRVGLFFLWLGGAGVALSLGVAGLLMLLDRGERRGDAPPSPLARETEPAQGPRLEADPYAALEAYRAAEGELLRTYGWADRKAGTYRLPVERAMDLILNEGLPARKP